MFTPVKGSRTFEEVSNQIKKLIFGGVFKPGDKLLPETELAQQFNVGRQSIREALRILELSGFITIQKGGGGEAVTTAVRHFMSELGPDAEFSDNEQWYNENIIQSKNTLAYHKEILNAVIEKKLDKAIDTLENHLQEVKNRLQPFALQNNN